MQEQWKIWLTTVMYFTRIRVPSSIDHSPTYLQKAPRYLPAVGWLVGGISVLSFLAFSCWLSAETAILASMIAGMLVTGAFHEDGFADVCDGFGGGWTKDKILLIMKDSRIGAYGAIGLMCMLGAKFLLLRELFRWSPVNGGHAWNNPNLLLAMVAGHSLSRLMPVLAMRWSVNVTDVEHSKSGPVTGGGGVGMAELAPATIFALAPFLFFPWYGLLVVLPVLGVTLGMLRWFRKWIGGYTGDCLGAIQQVAEIVVYLGLVAIWKST
ncbi:MAG: adenosylcobinamide-GDP ribazoletransferase [Bacteroidota bacterium]|nr:adenosylcobinamide-GDP ribazoletransferase [Bacteroidota bacterium]MDP4217294.1 adenosylcobinamide-GDP ribazoletransferase [Bacteroidota bacterium]MDP4246167.1 adenosylcobinamide-GDP ribazoletransferase [Bacteroidota bacterium]MDP4253974.1 adenosylcobinamide-GDP ribazoletransferase [Bacteroidota bacterium]MDP4257992.1 adenosylcobinamide-GDP ribazoletransferase [Bacteroidota bacterium]